jgi:hypothetical protein
MLGNHAMSDGVQWLGMLMVNSDNYNPAKFKNISGMSAWRRIFGRIIGPIYAVKVGIK